MSVEPGPEVVAVAKRVQGALEWQRQSLIAEIEQLNWAPGFDASSLPDPMPPLLRLTRSGLFLSVRLREQLSSVIAGSEDPESLLSHLRKLSLLPAPKEVCREILAYFLKYRFIDLSDIALETSASGGESAMVGRWNLPIGTSTLWSEGFYPDAPPDVVQSVIPSRVTAIPWLGSLTPSVILECIMWLVELGFLEFGYDSDVPADRAPLSGVPVVRCRQKFHILDPSLDTELRSIVEDSRRREERRRELLVDLGTAVRAVGGYETYGLIADSGLNDTLRISTYHLRTVVGERMLADWLAEKPSLRIRILCLGPTDIDGLNEGASYESLVKSLVRGIQNFKVVRSDLPRDRRDQVKIRVYGDVERQSYFRGAILADARENGTKPKKIVATVWPYGEARANYGECLKLDGDSSVARLLLTYYDDTWENSIPLPLYSWADSIAWVLSSIRFEAVVALIVLTASLGILLVRPDWVDGAYFGVLGLIPVVCIALFQVARRTFRALRLSIAVGKAHLSTPN